MRYFTVEEAAAVLPRVADLLRRLRALPEEADEAHPVLEALAEIGCVLRDVDRGLVDFPARAGGADIFLCWALGEDRIGFWHGSTEGYAGRRPLSELPGAHIH